MQTNEIVGQSKLVARLPEVDGASIAKRPMLDAWAKRTDAGGSRAVAAKQPEVTAGSQRNPRRYGAGF